MRSVLAGICAVLLTCSASAFTSPYINNPLQTKPRFQPPKVENYHPQTTGNRCAPLQAIPAILSGTPLGAISILAAIVCFHEIGHYSAAKTFGIKVEEFSVGFGPRLLSFNAFGDEFNLRALPLGGYVRFPENYNATEYRAQQNATYQVAKENGDLFEAGFGKNLLNVLTLGALEDKHRRQREEGYEKALDEYNSKPFWARTGKKQPMKPVYPEDVEIDYFDDPKLLQNRPWQERAVVISGGVIFNLLLSFSLYFGQISVGPGLPKPVFDQGVVVSAAPRPDTAASGLLRKGDVILSINGSPVSKSSSPSPFEAQQSVSEFISRIRKNPEGEPIKLGVARPSEKGTVDVEVLPKRGADSRGPQTIGVLLQQNFVKSEIMKTRNVGEAASLAYSYTSTLTSQTASGISNLLGQFVSGRGSEAGAQVSGPIGLIRSGSEVVSTQDYTAILLFAAAISINLGVINALPLPALDGGQLLFVLAEAVTGRKIDQRVQEGITGVAVFLLLLLSLSAAIGDVSAIVVPR